MGLIYTMVGWLPVWGAVVGFWQLSHVNIYPQRWCEHYEHYAPCLSAFHLNGR